MIQKILTIFKSRRHWENKLLVGAPGTGKTTKMKELIDLTDFSHYLIWGERDEYISQNNVEVINNRTEFIKILRKKEANKRKSIIIIDEGGFLIEDDYLLLNELLKTGNAKLWINFHTLSQLDLNKNLRHFLKNFKTFYVATSLNGSILKADFSTKLRRMTKFDFLELSQRKFFRQINW